MQIFIDSADIKEIREAASMGVIDGVTTNPSLVAKTGRRFEEVLKDILEQALPATMQDVVIVFVTVSGMKDGALQQQTYARKIYSHVLAGKMRSAIQITTASSLCAMLDLLAAGRLPSQGFIRQEDLSLPDFLANRFGRVFALDELSKAA